MNVYVAAPFPEMGMARELCEKLKGLGFGITSSWAYGAEFVPESLRPMVKQAMTGEVDHPDAEETFERISLDDLADIDAAEVLVKLPGLPEHRSAGRVFEAGYAYGTGKTVIFVGKPENIFDWLPDAVRVADIAELIRVLTTMAKLVMVS